MSKPESAKSRTKMPVYVVLGTRAQAIKMAPVMALMQKEGIDYTFIYTAQHRETVQEILDTFGVKKPDMTIYDRDEANTMRKIFGWWGSMLLKLFAPRKIFPNKGIILTHGDTATTAWAAICAKLAGCKVAHVESGLRSFNIFQPFPEELMRLITFQFSDVYFCPNEWAVNNLKRYKGEKVNMKVNPLYDAVILGLNTDVKTDAPKEKYIVVSIHRYENIFKPRFEEQIIPLLETVADLGFKLIFVLHPSTREVLNSKPVLKKRLEDNPDIILKPRYPFTEWIKLTEGAEFVITDGGSNQEELSYMGKPTLLFRSVTERVEGLDETAVISNYDKEQTVKFAKEYKKYRRPPLKLKNSPSKIITDYLKKL